MATILTAQHIKSTCKPGKGLETCSYITICPDGYVCCKGTPTEAIILQRQSTMTAQGDNCLGTTGSVPMKEVTKYLFQSDKIDA